VIAFVAGHPSVDRLYEVETVQPGRIHRPSLVRVVPGGKGLNAEEAAEALGVTAPESDALRWAAGAASDIHGRVPGNRITVLTCGTNGMALVDGSGEPLGGHIDEVSRYPVGSGDAVLASIALSFLRSAPAREMLAQPLAAGAANAEVPGPGILDPDRVPALAARASIAPIPV
jgi:fructose-1-phosphate kinase PfkB-like protein